MNVWTQHASEPLPERRIGVFIDYWYSYAAARALFAEPPGTVPPPWFGNVPPVALARHLVKMPLPGRPRSTRTLASTHVVISYVDPQAQPRHAQRVDEWREAGADVTICPSPATAPAHRRGIVHVALAVLVAHGLDSGACDTAIVFAADAVLHPLFTVMAAGGRAPSERIERAMWVAPDRTPTDGLASVEQVWCHRLGDRTFRVLQDDRSHVLARRRGAERATSLGPSPRETAALPVDVPAPQRSPLRRLLRRGK